MERKEKDARQPRGSTPERKAPPIEREHETADGALGASEEREKAEAERSHPLVPEDGAQRH